ncbi:hypothetical protein CLI64_16450 [Nostoc sp. CENA543]|uniref:protein kinase domain-containing protein n=1 Tax=Nostoc sp. CENA543 TaxID=1869241 RepID=UPI000CA1EB24|nr:protein kinase [Nostoc sp. CENA543]AUT01848.1 hypothetical protein CLI64_16450 [Nostoc sp. CENA543]
MDAHKLINTVIRKRYRILQFLGSGSFGDTYIAEDIDLPNHPKCVVKQLKPKTSEQEVMLVARRLFESEARTLYHLGNLSNQIPKLLAHFEENGEFYLVQELIEGCDLTVEIIPGMKWGEGEVIKLLQEILQVLMVVHQENIIHRDIKPQNLMRRSSDHKIILIDFGAVKEIKGLAANTQGQVTSTIAIGSSGYMPNEQANSKPKLCSDIYAVGVIGIQALTGKSPHDFQEDPHNGEIIWRNEANVSKELADVLTKMVRYNFSQRYQTASEALQALNSLKPKFSLQNINLVSWQSLLNWKVMLTSILVLLGFVFSRYLVNSNNQNDHPQNPPSSPPIIAESPTNTVEKLPQLPCDQDQQLFSPPIAEGKPAWENSTYKYYGDINPKTKEANGRGLMVFKKNGFQYYGDFKNNKRHGCGRLSYPLTSDINYYLGQFQEDTFQGLGRLKLKNQNEYIGSFVNNKCQGMGVYVFRDKTEKSGSWYEDKLEGNKSLSCKQSSVPIILNLAFLNIY